MIPRVRPWRITILFAFACISLTAGVGAANNPADHSARTAPPIPYPKAAHHTDTPAWHNALVKYYGVHMTGATDGWIVGDDGTILRHTAIGWNYYPSPTTNTLRAVDSRPAEAWAVGASNITTHFDGSAWQVVASPAPPTTTLRDVKIIALGEAWAAGNAGNQPVVMHYLNGNWELVSTPVITSGITLYQMSWTSPNDGWLVGANGGDSGTAVAYHYTGSGWNQVALPAAGPAYSISMLDSNDGWIGLGETQTYLGGALHYQGGSWQQVSTNTTVMSILATDANTFYTAGCGNYAPCEPFYVSPVFFQQGLSQYGFSYGAEGLVVSISKAANGDVWGVGPIGIFHLDARGRISDILTGVPGNEVQTFDQSNTLALSSQGTLRRYKGGYWSTIQPFNLYPFANSSRNDGWAIGHESAASPNTDYTIFYHLINDQYASIGEQNFTANYPINAMQMLSANEGWAVADNAIFHYITPTWTLQNRSEVLYAVNFDSPGDGWAVGDNDVVLHYTGGSWQAVPITTTNASLHAVYALAPNNVWVGGWSSVGGASQLLHWNGSVWSAVSVPVGFINDIKMVSPTEGWAGGTSEMSNFYSQGDAPLLHYVGGGWQPGPIIKGGALSISFASATEGFAIGTSGALRYSDCNPFYSDVPIGHWATGPIVYLTCRAILSGPGDGSFHTDDPATRIQFAKLITIARGWPLITPTTQTFSDVPPSNPLYTFVETTYANGAISGAAAATCTARGLAAPCFLPNDPISRA